VLGGGGAASLCSVHWPATTVAFSFQLFEPDVPVTACVPAGRVTVMVPLCPHDGAEVKTVDVVPTLLPSTLTAIGFE
jgi:hypothetical protein